MNEFRTTIIESDLSGDRYNPETCPGALSLTRVYREYRNGLPWYKKIFNPRRTISWGDKSGHIGLIKWRSFNDDGSRKSMISSELGDVVIFKRT